MALGGGVRPFLAAIALLSLGVSAFKAGMNTLLINAAPHAQAGLTSGLHTFASRLRPHAPSLQPYVPSLQPYVPSLQPYVLGGAHLRAERRRRGRLPRRRAPRGRAAARARLDPDGAALRRSHRPAGRSRVLRGGATRAQASATPALHAAAQAQDGLKGPIGGEGGGILYALGRLARLFPGCNALSIGWRAAGVENTQARVPAGERQARPLASRRGTRERVPVACRVAARPAARPRAARVIRKVGRLCVFLAAGSSLCFYFSFAPGPRG